VFAPTHTRNSDILRAYASAGTLGANIARNVPLSQAVPRAILCASLSVTKRGAQCSCPTVADLQQLTLDGGTSGADFLPPPAEESRDATELKMAMRATLGI
jgi:hypothetical protein